MLRSRVLPEIESLDPVKDHQRIVFLSTRVDFPFDTTRALEFALFRTFAVPTIGGLLDRTQEFERRAQKRYDDTDLLVSALIEHGYDSERGRRAIARMNALHGRSAIRNEDFLYVLSTFVFEPIRWNARFGWRRPVHAGVRRGTLAERGSVSRSNAPGQISVRRGSPSRRDARQTKSITRIPASARTAREAIPVRGIPNVRRNPFKSAKRWSVTAEHSRRFSPAPAYWLHTQPGGPNRNGNPRHTANPTESRHQSRG
jgi:hypothetical protein